MSLSTLPLLLLLLLPGFLSINSLFLIGSFRRLTAIQASLWSLSAGLFLLALVYPLYTLLVRPSSTAEEWPGLIDILVSPELAPVQVWAILYVLSIPAGALLGIAERKGFIKWLFARLGIDLNRRGDLWSTQWDSADYVQVYLTNGTLIVGWPELWSLDRSPPGPELYLTRVKVWSAVESAWLNIEGVRGILLHGDEISRIEFLESDDENEKEAAP